LHANSWKLIPMAILARPGRDGHEVQSNGETIYF
jgi:hypothetical protein